jgi:hypothetical protein
MRGDFSVSHMQIFHQPKVRERSTGRNETGLMVGNIVSIFTQKKNQGILPYPVLDLLLN